MLSEAMEGVDEIGEMDERDESLEGRSDCEEGNGEKTVSEVSKGVGIEESVKDTEDDSNQIKEKERRRKELQRAKRRRLLDNKAIQKLYDGRLMITHMELENFKSYAGVVTIGPFHERFSAIIGPNGSGKSNVIDAMLFVFGKRAKKLRLKKVSQLIHKSREHPGAQFARVTVFFENIRERQVDEEGDNEVLYDTVPETKIQVTRIAYINNKSEYFIDSKKATFTEVYNTLIQRGVDLHQNRFLILQGEVEQISLMKPKKQNEKDDDGLLEYLEDIIGTNKYVEKVEDLEELLEDIDVQAADKLNLIKVSEKNLEGLEEPKNEALEFMEVEREKIYFKHQQIQLHVASTNIDLESVKKLIENLESKRLQIISKKTTETGQSFDEKALKEFDNRLKMVNELCNKTLTKLNDLKARISDFQCKEIKLKSELEELENMISRENQKKMKIEEELKLCSEDACKNQALIPELDKELTILKKQKESEEEQLEILFSELKLSTDPLREELEEFQKKLAPMQLKKAELNNELEVLQTEKNIITMKKIQAEEGITETREQMQTLENEAKEIPKIISNLSTELHDKEVELEKNQGKLVEKKELETRLQDKINSKRIKIEAAKINLESHTQGRVDSLVEKLLNIQQTGNKGGETWFTLVGRVGSLAAVDKKYDVAVSTACGTLNHLVTETSLGAEKCIKYLRKHKLGRASFVVLEKLQYLHPKISKGALQFQSPRNSERVFDVINFDHIKRPSHSSLNGLEYIQGIRSAFFLGLKDTLVVDNLDLAVQTAFTGNRRYRVVTTGGQLIEQSGAISGGGSKACSGLIRIIREDSKEASSSDASSSILTKQIKEEQIKLQNYLEKLRVIRDKLNELETLKEAAMQKTKELKFQLKEKRVIQSTLGRKKEQLSKRIEKLLPKTNLSKDDLQKINVLDGKQSDLRTRIENVEKEAKSSEDKCTDLQEQINNINDSKTKDQRETIAKLIKEEAATGEKLHSCRMQLEAQRNKRDRLENSLRDLDADVEAYKADKISIATYLKENGCERNIVETEVATIQEKFDEQVDEKKIVQEQLEELKKMKQELQRALAEVEGELELKALEKSKILEKMSVYTQKLSSCQKEFSNYLPAHLKSTVQVKTLLDTSDDLPAVYEESKPEFNNYLSLQELPTGTESQDIISEKIQHVSEKLKSIKTSNKTNINIKVVDDFFSQQAQLDQKIAELGTINTERESVQKELDEIKKRRLEEFMTAFQDIALSLKMLYQMLTLGGDADLDLVDSLDPFSEGITFSVRPPKKSWKNIKNLSGGEKTLSSLALVFALHKYERNALYVMDEIDAALDFRNVSIVGNYIKERTQDAQFIIISLRNNMFGLADRLVGIYKTQNATKSITIDPAIIARNLQKKEYTELAHSKKEILKENTKLLINT